MTNYSITPRREYDRDADWRERAECLKPDVNAEVFHPAGYDWDTPQNALRAQEAKAICDRCEVKASCLEGALKRREKWAVLGGTLPHERDLMLRNATRAAKRDAS